MSTTYNYGVFDAIPPKSEIPDLPVAALVATPDEAAAESVIIIPPPEALEPPVVMWTSELRGLKCLTDDTITRYPARPWEWDKSPPAVVLHDKVVFAAWCKKPTTDHLFYTGIEAVNPMLRVSKDNPPEILHAIIFEYDGVTLDEQLDLLSSKLPEDLLPTYTSRSRFSGGCRLIWMLENPLNISSTPLVEAYLKHAAKELKAKLLAPGFDEESLRPKQTFEVGTDWKRAGGPLRDATVQSWLFKAALRSDAKLIAEEKDALHIPMDDIALEVARQFPGRWTGAFEKGARGVVFFDATSVNPSAAVIVDEGVVCFGQIKTFYPWKEILGSVFVRKYDEDRIAMATAHIWHDGDAAWFRSIRNGRWEKHKDHHLDLYFTEGCQLTREGAKSAKKYLLFDKRIDQAKPFVGDHREMITHCGKKTLNTWVNNVMPPMMGIAGPWGDGFPWLAKFFDTRFDNAFDPLSYAKWHLLAWWKVFYKNMYEGTPANGQSIAISGGTSVGKTLFLSKMLAASVGGSADATNFLQTSTNFNSQLFEVPVWTIDDGSFSADHEGRKRFAEMIKKCAATADWEHHAKNQTAGQVKWYGRSVILLNTDPESIQAIPKLDISNRDKFNLYRWVEKSPAFPDRGVVEATVARELPYLLSWLLEFDPAAYAVASDTRYGISSYIERDTAEEAENASGAGTFEQVLTELCRKSAMSGDVNI